MKCESCKKRPAEHACTLKDTPHPIKLICGPCRLYHPPKDGHRRRKIQKRVAIRKKA